VGARLLSVLWGVLAIPVLWAVGRRVGRERAGLWAALLLAISPFHIYYSQEVRMYGMVTCLGALGVWLSLEALERRQAVWWAGAGLALLAALYTQYYAVFIILALTVFLVVDRRWQEAWRAWRGVLAGIALAYLPWVWYTAPRLITYVRYKVSMDKDLPLAPWEFLRRILLAYGAGHLEDVWQAWWPLGLVPAALALAGAAWLLLRRRRHPAQGTLLALGLAWLLIPWLGGYLINVIAPFNPPRSERLMLISLPAFLMLGGEAIQEVLDKTRPAVRWAAFTLLALYTVVIGLSLVGYYTVPRYPQEDYRELARFIEARYLPDDAVICVFPWQVGYFQAYLASPPALIETPSQLYPQARQFWADDPARMARELDALLQEHGRLWMPAYLATGSRLEGMVLDYLDARAVRAYSHWYGTTLLTMYVPVPALVPAAGAVDFAGMVRAADMQISREPLSSAYGSVVVQVTWQSPVRPDEDYHIVFRLADDQGRTWVQWDREPLWGRRPFSAWEAGDSLTERYGLLLDAGLPPGRYQLWLSLRRPGGTPLPVLSMSSMGIPTEALLGMVEVTRPAHPVPPAAVQAQYHVQADLGEAVRLVAYDLPPTPWRPGDTVEITLYWQCRQAPEEELVAFVQLLDKDGRLSAAAELPPTAGVFPAARWQAGDIIRDQQELTLPAALPDGAYQLIAGLFRASDHSRLPVVRGPGRGRDYIPLEKIGVRGRPHSFTPPQPAHAADVRFGGLTELVGYDWRVEQGAGEQYLVLTLYWHALRDGDRRYKVFVHAFDDQGVLAGQHDSVPGAGQFPTSGWVAGEYIADEHPVLLPAGFLIEHLGKVQVGLYDNAGRLPAFTSAGQPLGDYVEIDLAR
ncbi:MAG: glycosyltransferase family 39 protein, partial [Anaerolineae bacterium]